jgi:raffinose/stachyose/melibiose transport system permease protein
MTAGGPGRSTEVLATAMYRSGFRNDEMGYAAAFAVVLFVITFLFTLIQIKVSRTSED